MSGRIEKCVGLNIFSSTNSYVTRYGYAKTWIDKL